MFLGNVDALYFAFLGISAFFSALIAFLVVYFAIRYRRRDAAEVAAGENAAPVEETVSSQPYRVRCDLDLCQGHAVCMGEAPEVFDIDSVDGEDKVVLVEETPSPALRRKVERAVKYCPTQALRVEEID